MLLALSGSSAASLVRCFHRPWGTGLSCRVGSRGPMHGCPFRLHLCRLLIFSYRCLLRMFPYRSKIIPPSRHSSILATRRQVLEPTMLPRLFAHSSHKEESAVTSFA